MATAAATHHDLIALMAESLHERAAYIVEHADTIGVRVKHPYSDQWADVRLSQLTTKSAIREAFRLLLRSETPVRKVGGRPIGEDIPPARSGDADPAAGDG